LLGGFTADQPLNGRVWVVLQEEETVVADADQDGDQEMADADKPAALPVNDEDANKCLVM